MIKKYLSYAEIYDAARKVLKNLADYKIIGGNIVVDHYRVYGIPRGGVPCAMALCREADKDGISFTMTDDPSKADIIVDDIYDSGDTFERYATNYPEATIVTLYNKESDFPNGDWVVFPWEKEDGLQGDMETTVTRLLQQIGEDATREGLQETPARVAKAWAHWTKGYNEVPRDILKVFEDGASDYDEMVCVKDIPFYSHCEHHLAPIFGTVTIAYIPDGKIVGLSKLSRLVDVFARRLQVQERMTTQIADAMVTALAPKGVGVLVTARHLCMESRGICQQGHQTVTSALRGACKDQHTARAEFLALAGGKL